MQPRAGKVLQATPKVSVLLTDSLNLVRASLRALVEDDPSLLVIGDTGDGYEAIKLIGKLKPDFLILDSSLPGPAPDQVMRQAFASHQLLKIVLMADPSDAVLAAHLLEAGAVGCYFKSDAPQEFLSGLHAVARGELSVSATMAPGVVRSEAAEPPSPRRSSLTSRESEILSLADTGLSNRDIAGRLSLSIHTVATSLKEIYEKLGVNSRLQAATTMALWCRPDWRQH